MNNIYPYKEKKYRLADFFNSHWDKYLQGPTRPIKKEQFKAVNAIRACRTAILGKRGYACEECGDVSEVFHSCKHRFCPTCSWTDTLKWAERAYLKLLNIPHRHAVATLPHALNPLLAKNYKKLNNALLRSSAETIKDWMNAKAAVMPGIMSVLHTFGEKKNRHHHSHMIVSMGGINKETDKLKTVAVKFIPYKFLSKKFRIKFEDIFVELFDNGELQHDFKDRTDMLIFLKKINKDNWRFHFEPPMEDAAAIIRYIGRYSKRACLSEHKITNIQGDYISFRYKDNKNRDAQNKAKEEILTLHYKDFFPRLLQHVPAIGFQIIRYYGLYANSNKIKDTHTNKAPIEKQGCTTYKNPKKCEYCGVDKINIYIVFDKRKAKQRIEKFDIYRHRTGIIPLKEIA